MKPILTAIVAALLLTGCASSNDRNSGGTGSGTYGAGTESGQLDSGDHPTASPSAIPANPPGSTAPIGGTDGGQQGTDGSSR
ncbi:MAG: hypothetical protein U1G07_24080 [Verrucomicrobiota bacterium]